MHGTTVGVEGDTISLDYSSNRVPQNHAWLCVVPLITSMRAIVGGGGGGGLYRGLCRGQGTNIGAIEGDIRSLEPKPSTL